jgi:hypothetical protein
MLTSPKGVTIFINRNDPKYGFPTMSQGDSVWVEAVEQGEFINYYDPRVANKPRSIDDL